MSDTIEIANEISTIIEWIYEEIKLKRIQDDYYAVVFVKHNSSIADILSEFENVILEHEQHPAFLNIPAEFYEEK